MSHRAVDAVLFVRTKSVNLESSHREALELVWFIKISHLYSSEIFAFFPKNSIILTIQNFLKIQRGYRMGYTVAVVGATGAVGSQMIKMLEESSLPIDKIRYLASARSS